MNLKKWFIIFGLQGTAIGAASLVISLYAVYGLNGNVRSATSSTALFSLGNLAGSIIISAVIDKLKRFNKLISVSLLFSSIAFALIFFVRSIELYYLLAFILGVSVSFIGPVLTLYVNRTLADLAYRRAVNFLNTFNSFGVTFGMLAGSFILNAIKAYPEASKMKLIFVMSSVFLFISTIISFEKIREGVKITIKPSISSTKVIFDKIIRFQKSIFSTINIISLPQNIKLFITANFLVFFGANIFLSVFSIFLKQSLNFTSQTIFLLYAINNFASNLAFLVSNRIVKKQWDWLLIKLVIIIRILAIFTIALLSLIGIKNAFKETISYIFIIFGFSWPFFYLPITFEAGELVKEKERGRIFGLLNISINTAVISASFLSGIITLKFGYVVTFFFGSFMLIFGGVVFSKVFRKHLEKS